MALAICHILPGPTPRFSRLELRKFRTSKKDPIRNPRTSSRPNIECRIPTANLDGDSLTTAYFLSRPRIRNLVTAPSLLSSILSNLFSVFLACATLERSRCSKYLSVLQKKIRLAVSTFLTPAYHCVCYWLSYKNLATRLYYVSILAIFCATLILAVRISQRTLFPHACS